MKVERFSLPQGIKMDFVGSAPKTLQARKNKVVAALKDNGPFKDAQSVLNEVIELGEKYDELCLKVELGNKALIPERVNAAYLLTAKMFTLANWCTFIANGDASLLASTGFALNREPQPKPVFSEPKNLRATATTSLPSGSIGVRIDRVIPAGSYRFEAALFADGVTAKWESFSYNRISYIFNNLVPGLTYCIRVGAVDSDGNTLYCDALKAVAKL